MKSVKHKISVDKRVDIREFDGKLRDDEVITDAEVFAEAVEGAGWSDDPGTGRSILLADGREVPNPMPLAPPVTFSEELTVNQLVDRALRMHFENIERNQEAVETLDDLLVFDDEVDDFPRSRFEVEEGVDMQDEAPVIPVVPDVVPPAPPLEPTEKPPAS